MEIINELLQKSNENYRENGVSNLTDEDYDILKEYVNKNNGDIDYENDDFIEYTFINQNFQKGDYEKYKKWSSNVNIEDITFSPKLDGVSIIFHNNLCFTKRGLKKGKLLNINIFKDKINLDDIKNLSNKTGIKCELVVKKKVFEEININNLYSHHLSYIVSIINKKDITNDHLKNLDLIIHSPTNKSINVSDFISLIKKYNLEKNLISFETINKNISKKNLYDLFYKLKNNCEYDIDGIVFDFNIEEKIITNYNPETDVIENLKFMFGFKPSLNEYIVSVKNITWKIVQNNMLVPVINFDNSITNNGKIYNKCSGHNYKFLLDRKIGVNAIIKIKISGNLIPTICGTTLFESQNLDLPEEYTYNINLPNIYIINETNEQFINNLFKFYKNFKGISKKILEKLVKNNFKYLHDILNPENKKKILLIDGIADKTYNLLTDIKNEYSLEDIILSSPYFNKIISKQLIKNINLGNVYFDGQLQIKDVKFSNETINLLRKDQDNFNKWFEELKTYIKIK